MSKIKNYKEYINLPEYSTMISLLKRGIGIHHAGILSIFRDAGINRSLRKLYSSIK